MKKIIVTLFFLITVFCVSTAALAAECTYTASVDGDVSLYLSPSVDSYEIMTIPACSKVNVLEKSGSWGLIEYDNKTGWINMSYTRSSYKKAAEATGVNSEKLIMVKSASETTALCDVPDAVQADKKKGQAVPNGTVLEIYRETATGWGLVLIDEEYTWIDLSETVPYTHGIDVKQYEIYYVYALSKDGKGVTMWETEKADKVCAVIPDCTQLTAREKSGEYIYVSYAGMNGWIEGACTEISLFNAQVQSGQEVKMCYTVDSGDPKNEVDLMSVPSYKEKDGANIIATVPDGTEVLVLRRVRGDWNLVQYNDKLGWIPPGSLKIADPGEYAEDINVFETPEEGYIATSDANGLKLFSKASKGKETAILPETAKVKIVAEKGDYKYVVCDYASGWAKDISLAGEFEEAVRMNAVGKDSYTVKKQKELMSMPTTEEKIGSEMLCLIEDGVTVKKLRTVNTGEEKWALVEYEGNIGWIKVSAHKNGAFPVWAIILIVFGVLAVALVIFYVVKKKVGKPGKTSGEEFEKKTEEELEKETAEIPVK